MKKLPLQSDLETFRAALTSKIGFRFDDDRLPFLSNLLSARMLQTRLASAAYFERLATSGEELAELVRVLTVTETYFLRNSDQFCAFAELLRARAARGDRSLRLLSAGSASGEEAYSLAIVLRETLGDLHDWTISILGVDLNPDVIAKARNSSYSAWSMRETPERVRQKYFRQEGARFVLESEIRDMVCFEQRNLLDAAGGLWRQEAYDAVFCRNVLMYFEPETARGVIARIASSLAPEGYLFLGHAENLRGLSQDFHLLHTHNTFYYQRRAMLSPLAQQASSGPRKLPATLGVPDATQDTASDDTNWFEAIANASGRIERLSLSTAPASARPATELASAQPTARAARHGASELLPAMDMLKQERFQEALRLLTSAPATARQDPDALLLRAMLLASIGQRSEAEALCRELLALDELNAGAHYIMAICREYAADRQGAIEHSEAAAYLDSDFAMPHLQLGRLARRMGDSSAARRELSLALRLLAGEDAARITLFGGGFGRDVLMQLCRAELAACGGE